MTDFPDHDRPRGWLYSIPVLGWFSRDLARDFHGNFYYFLVIVLTALILAVQTWGLAALTMTAVVLTPVIFVLLVRLTVGR